MKGWRSAFIPHPSAFILLALLFPSLYTWGYFVALGNSWQGQAVYWGGKTIQFALPVLWLLAVKSTTRGKAAPPPPAAVSQPALRSRGLVLGLIFGAAVLAAIVLLYHFCFAPERYHDLWFRGGHSLASARQEVIDKLAAFGVHGLPRYVLLAAFYSLVHSLLEEYYWRWFVFGRLCEAMPWQAAAAVAAVGFMGHHVIVLGTYFGWSSPATWLFSAGVALGGAFWAWLYHTSRSLVSPWLSHALVDAAIFVVGYSLAGPL